MPFHLTHHLSPRPLYSRSWPHERRNMRSVWPNWEGGNLIRTTDAAGAQTVYTYDTEGQLLTVTDALNNVTSYTYDALGRLLTTTDARGTVTRNTYDAVGNLLQTKQYDPTELPPPVGTWLDIEQDFNGSSTIKILGGRADIDYKVRLFVKGKRARSTIDISDYDQLYCNFTI